VLWQLWWLWCQCYGRLLRLPKAHGVASAAYLAWAVAMEGAVAMEAVEGMEPTLLETGVDLGVETGVETAVLEEEEVG
jgi:hypothetical protein